MRLASVAALVLIATLLAACEGATPAAETSDIAGFAPFSAGESLRYSLLGDDGEVVGFGTLTVTEDAGRFILDQHFEAIEAQAGQEPTTDTISVTVDAVTMKPLAGSRHIDVRSEDGDRRTEDFEWQYVVEDGEARLVVETSVNGGEVEQREIDLPEHYYDNESSLWLWRTLPLAVGYEADYVSVNPLEPSDQQVNVQVPQEETIEVPAGTFETWRILLRSGRAVRTAWVNMEKPHQIVRWDNGDLIFELEPPPGDE